MKAVVCKVGVPTPEVVELSDNPNTAFKECQDLVGGYVERIRHGKFDLYCNEDGRLLGLPVNRTVAGRPIVGTFVMLRYGTPDPVGLTDNEAKWLVNDLSPGGCLSGGK